MKKRQRRLELVKGKDYYGSHSTGWVLLVNGYPEFQGTKREMTKKAVRLMMKEAS